MLYQAEKPSTIGDSNFTKDGYNFFKKFEENLPEQTCISLGHFKMFNVQ